MIFKGRRRWNDEESLLAVHLKQDLGWSLAEVSMMLNRGMSGIDKKIWAYNAGRLNTKPNDYYRKLRETVPKRAKLSVTCRSNGTTIIC